jgi:hypothetical protein
VRISEENMFILRGVLAFGICFSLEGNGIICSSKCRKNLTDYSKLKLPYVCMKLCFELFGMTFSIHIFSILSKNTE